MWLIYNFHSYATLYVVKNKIDTKSISITLIGSKNPRELFKHFEEDAGYKIKKMYNGVYYVSGGMFPLQVIVTPELSKREDFWLSNLRNDLSRQEVSSVLDAIYPRNSDENVKIYSDVVMRANAQTFNKERDMLNDKEMYEAFRGTAWAKEWLAEGRAEGVAQGRAEGIQKVFSLLRSGRSLQEAERILNVKKKRMALA